MSCYMVELLSTSGLVAALNGRRTDWLAVDADAIADAPGSSAAIRHVHHDRDFDFGVGYGNSSGYATDRHYVSEWSPRRFRCY